MPSDTAEPDARPMHGFLRILWRIILTGHAAAAAGWMWMMPGGFPIGHARWWANRALPLLVIVACVVGAWAGWRRKDVLLRHFALGVPIAWLAAAVAGRIVFPISARWVWLAPLGVAVVLGALAGWAWLGARFCLVSGGPVIAAAVVVGVAVPLTQLAPAPSTRPLDEASGVVPSRHGRDVAEPSVDLASWLRVYPADGMVRARCGEIWIDVHPMLRFWSRSPDRCWTIFAPRRFLRDAPPRAVFVTEQDGGVFATCDGSDLWVEARDGAATVVAHRRLEDRVYSHLNTFCQIDVEGARKLALAFSPAPDVPIEVRRADYPVGRPARFAYFTEDRLFHVVEASSGEKGPFRVLAAGPLRRGWSLVITLLDAGEPVCRIVLDDWAAQASTALSPTAGWGVPQNAIEFGLGEGGDASIYITLAATSVGRGWDSVGHAAGVYRNRMRIEPIPPPETGGDAQSQMRYAR